MITRAGQAALLAGGVALLCLPGGAAKSEPDAVRAFCELRPEVLDVRVGAGELRARIELFSSDGLVALRPRDLMGGVFVSRVGDAVLPPPESVAEGIDESVAERIVEDAVDVRGGLGLPNGIPEVVVRFTTPCDGVAATRNDGDAGDVLAMLSDVPHGASVGICVAGRVSDGSGFECCDTIEVRNRGLRDLPVGLFPSRPRVDE